MKDEKINNTPGVIIAIGIVLGFSMGFLDLSISLLSERPFGLSSFLSLLQSLGLTICFFFFIYLILWFIVVSRLGRFVNLGPIRLSLSLAMVIGLFFALTLLSDLAQTYLLPINSFNLLIIVSLYLLIAIGVYFATKAVINLSTHENSIVIFGLIISSVLTYTIALIWLCLYKIESFFSIQYLFVFIAYISVVLFTLFLFNILSKRVQTPGLLAVFIALIILTPLITLAVTKGSKAISNKAKEPNRKIKHVIFITVDTLRPDVLSCYNSEKNVPTPDIDQLAKDGIIFTNAFSAAPWTLPSFSSIMTGLSPFIHDTKKSSSRLPDDFRTLAEYMRDSGYFTSAIVHNPYLKPQFNLSQGFLEYDFFPKSQSDKLLMDKLGITEYNLYGSTRLSTELAIKWLRSNSEKDFFFWVHYLDPHIPYAPPPAFLPEGDSPPRIGTSINDADAADIRYKKFIPTPDEKEWIKKLYYGEVRFVSENIGKLLKTLKELNLYDESLIIFTSDHGEEFWEHGGYEHGHSLYNEVLRVPLIVKLPNSAFKGQVDTRISTQRITPTILKLLGIEPENDYLNADSLSPLWESSAKELNKQPIVSTGLLYFEDRESVIFDGKKYIHFLSTDREEFYDLDRNPGEKNSILNSSKDKVKQAKSVLKENKEGAKRFKRVNKIESGQEMELDKETTEQLKSLGYLQ